VFLMALNRDLVWLIFGGFWVDEAGEEGVDAWFSDEEDADFVEMGVIEEGLEVVIFSGKMFLVLLWVAGNQTQ